MATSDMSLGGGAGFGANYTPIRFAPLVSLTGPVMAPATPAAPEAAAPMAPAMRLPQMSDMPDNAYMTGGIPAYGGASIGNRSGAEIRGDLARIGGFFMSPLATMASYAMTGKSPMELMSQGAQSPFGGFLQGLQDSFARNVFGPEEVSLAGGPGGVDPIASYQNAINVSLSGGATQEMADAAGRAALGLISQGMDPTAAVALASMTALGQVGPQMGEGLPTSGASGMLGGTPAGNQLLSDIYGAMQFAPGSTETGPGGTSLSQESSYEGSYGGGWGPGDTPGGYDTNTGAYSDVTGYE